MTINQYLVILIKKGVMGLEPMTNRVTDYYSSTELYFLRTLYSYHSSKIPTIGLEPIHPKDNGFY